MTAEVQYHWRYYPLDVLPGLTTVSVRGRTVTIGDGWIVMYFPAGASPGEYADEEALTHMVRCVLGGLLLQPMRHFTLDEPLVKTVMEDGRVFADVRYTLEIHMDDHADVVEITPPSLGVPPALETGQTGGTSRAQRMVVGEAERSVWQTATEVIPRHAEDELLQRLVRSFTEAARDSANEFVYLFEILEALETKFDDYHAACAAIAFPEEKWRRLLSLANDKRILQGRHRGQGLKEQRAATPGERQEARSIAREMLVAYARSLDGAAGEGDSKQSTDAS